jgi:hypothetical protein
MIQFEKEVLGYLNIPSIPKKEFDGKTAFSKGVAVVETIGKQEAFAIASFNPDNGDKEPKIVKVFGIEPFRKINKIFIVPSYMNTEEEIKDMDLDEQSKKKVQQVLDEAKEIENEGVVGDKELEKPKNEYYFDHITNDEEAKAFIRSYNSRNHIKGKIPSTHDGIVMRLAVIFSDTRKASR